MHSLYKLLLSQSSGRLRRSLLDRDDLGNGDLLGDDRDRLDALNITLPDLFQSSGRLDLFGGSPFLNLVHHIRLDVAGSTESVSQLQTGRILDRVSDLASESSDIFRQVLSPVNGRGECRGELSVDLVVLSGELREMRILDVGEVLSDVPRGLGQEIGSSRDEEERREGQA